MPLETANTAPLGRIDPNSLFSAPDPSIVEPRAISAMSDAFRSGLISAQDIQQRAMMRPAQQAAVQMATDPEVLAAQKASIVQAAEHGRLGNQAAALDLAQRQALANIPPIVQQMHAENLKFNLAIPKTPQQWTPQDSIQTFEIWKGIEKWKTERAAAEAEKAMIGDQEVIRGGQKLRVPINKLTSTEITSDAAASLAQWLAENPTPQAYFQKGQKPAPSLFGVTPGTATVEEIQAVPNAGPIQDAPPIPLATPAPAATGTPAATATTTVTPAATTSATPASGMALSDVGMETKAATEMQTKAALFGQRAGEAEATIKDLEAKGYNPASWSNWVQNYFMGPLEGVKTEQKKSYDAAATSWLQGLLRLESGAAISTKEEKWYRTGFFPVVGDSIAVQNQKANLRQAIEALAMQVAKQGHLDVEGLKAINARAQMLSEMSAPDSTKEASVSVSGVGNVSPVNASQGVVRVNYTPPSSLKAKPSPVVQPKK